MSRTLHSSMKALIPPAVRGIFAKGSKWLLNACDKGDLEAVTRLVEFWGVKVNATASFHFVFQGEPQKVLDASPLFVAAYRGHYEIVRYLIEKGADIFAKTSDHNDSCLAGLTPLYGSVASSDSTISTRQQDAIVRLLLESAGSNSSALLTTSESSRLRPIWRMDGCGPEATITLIKYGMSLNERSSISKDQFGRVLFSHRTILQHWASKSLCHNTDGSNEASPLELVQLLVEKGMDPASPDCSGQTSLFLSAAPGDRFRSLNFSVFDFLLEREEMGRLDKINALELAGASILSFSSDATQVPRAFAYWRRAHHLRYLDGGDPIPKTPIIFKKAPQCVEWTTLPQLEEIENDPSQHKIASLLVHLRMLSVSDDRLHGYSYMRYSPVDIVLYHFKMGLHQGFIKAVYSFFIALEFILRYDAREPALWTDTVDLDKKLVSLLNKNPHRCTSEILKTSLELITATDQSHLSEVNHLSYTQRRHLETLLRFVSILANHPEMLNKDIMDSLTQLVEQDGRTKDGLNLLLLACSKVSTRTDLSTTISLLLKAKAEPNVVDANDGRGPLHILASVIHDQQETVDSIAHQLLDAGAHLDMVDKEGRTPADIWLLVRNRKEKRPAFWKRKSRRIWDRHDLPGWCREDVPKLMCLCARVARRCNVPKVDKLPATLPAFVGIH